MLHHTITEKKKTTILLLHGYCEDSRMWQYFMQGLREEYQILRIDLPGFGKSKIDAEVSIAQMAQRVKKVIEHLKIDKFIFVGHSMGGYVALEFAKQFPQYLQGLSLFHSHPFADDEMKKKARSISAKSVETGDKKEYVQRLITSLFAANYQNESLLNKMIVRASKYPTAGLANGQRAMRDRHDNRPVLKEINVPVQFIVGTEDSAVPEQYSKEQTHLPKIADIQILQGIGHMGMFESHKKTKNILKAFVQLCEDFS